MAKQPDRDYSHRTRIQKLGVKPGQRVWVLGVSEKAFRRELDASGASVEEDEPAGDAPLDLVFFGASRREDLALLDELRTRIAPAGAVWAVYPKGRKEIAQMDVIAAAKAAGLVDCKVCAFSETHTGLKLVIPVADRPRKGRARGA